MIYKNISDNDIKLSAVDVLRSAGNPWNKTQAERAEMTTRLRDTDYMPRVEGAGQTKVVDGKSVQVMHNGLLVARDGYQGGWQTKVIEDLNGNHEPQEEKVFFEILKRITNPGFMIELGAWWSYYSMWYQKETGGIAIACEPDLTNVALGKRNAALNNIKEEKEIYFENVAAGKSDGVINDFVTESGDKVDIPVKSVDTIVEERNINQLDILHMDIQGFELDALHSALHTIKSGKLRFLFVSTHHYEISSNPTLHQECMAFIKRHGGHIIASHTIYESSSGDGLIVASFNEVDRDFKVDITLGHSDDSLFRSPEIDIKILWDAHNRLIPIINEQENQINRLQADLESANQQIAGLEGRLLEIGGIKSHAKKAVIARLRGLDHKAQMRLQGKKARSIIATSYSKDDSVRELIREVQNVDLSNYQNMTLNNDSALYKAYIKSSRSGFRTLRKLSRRMIK